MTEQRRYQEDEIREIFGAATEARSESLRSRQPAQGGLTLGDLQEIGREVGIEPERIADAARALGAPRDALTRSEFFGIPLGVSRTTNLPRPLTDDEWEFLVAEVRQTFRATGKQRREGKFRAWTNGNLHVVTEPAAGGHHLRMGTRKSDAVPLALLGVGWTIAGAFFVTNIAVTAVTPGLGLLLPLGFIGLGASTLVSLALRLPRWARTRERQMEHIGERALSLATTNLSSAE